MCNPLVIASAAATAAGTYMQYKSQQKAQDKINQAIALNDESNERLQRESQAAALEAGEGFNRENFDEAQNQETVKLRQQLTDNLSQGVLPGEFYGGRQSENTKQYAEIKDQEARDFSQQMADALANLRGFEQGLRVQNKGVQSAGEKAGMNQNFQVGNNAVLPHQIRAAEASAQNPLADILVGVGGVGLSAGLSGSAVTGPLNSQSSLSRTIAGMKDVQGPVNGFGGSGFNLV